MFRHLKRSWRYLGRPRRLIIARISLLLVLINIIYLFTDLLVPQIKRLRLRTDLSWFDLGLYGFYPTRSYASFDYVSPALELSRWDPRCSTEYTFILLRGDSVVHSGPMILDAYGELVWFMPLPGVSQDFLVQEYQGEKYITYWNGIQVDGHGRGAWYMLDSSYQQRFEIRAVGNFDGDLHEFHITKNGTALVTIYDVQPADLTEVGGPEFGYMCDGVFQEIDIATGNLIFEWRMSQHFALNSSYEHLDGKGKDRIYAYDPYHINSVDKDHLGNYILSARHTHSIMNIDAQTGEVLWVLGGKSNDFFDASDGRATNFTWQHDARWHGDHTMTLLDNHVEGGSWDESLQSRGMTIDLDIANRVATLRKEYLHPNELQSISQGNLQVLPESGNIFVAWGHNAALTEFDVDGTMLCDTHFGALGWFQFGRVVSYRTTKGTWVGRPNTTPDAVVEENSIYVSWNGATEVVAWRLELWDGADRDSMEFYPVDVFEKEGFETKIDLPSDNESVFFRVVALDNEDKELGMTEVLRKDFEWKLQDVLETSRWDVIIPVSMLGCSLLLQIYWRITRKSRSKFGQYEPVPSDNSSESDEIVGEEAGVIDEIPK